VRYAYVVSGTIMTALATVFWVALYFAWNASLYIMFVDIGFLLVAGIGYQTLVQYGLLKSAEAKAIEALKAEELLKAGIPLAITGWSFERWLADYELEIAVGQASKRLQDLTKDLESLKRRKPKTYYQALGKVTGTIDRLERSVRDAKKDIQEIRETYPKQGFSQEEINQAIREYKADFRKAASETVRNIEQDVSKIGRDYQSVHKLSEEDFRAWLRGYLRAQIPDIDNWI